MSKFFRTILGILLIPLAIGVAKAFYVQIGNLSVVSHTLHILERGMLLYFAFHIVVARPAYLYVLAHEFVHVIATWLCGGHVVAFNVTPSGGNVVTSKTNFFIELSPYFVPLYTLLMGPIYLVMRSMGQESPTISAVFVFLVGVTLAFHFAMTSEVLRLQQSDITKSGIILSFVLIFIGNLVVIIGAFSPIFSDISFLDFLKSSAENSGEVYKTIYSRSVEFIGSIDIS